MIYPFATSPLPTLAQVGGKGLSLMRMTQAGFPTHWHAMALMSMLEHKSPLDEQIMTGCKVFLQRGIEQGEIDPLDVVTIAHSSYLCGDFGADLLALCLGKIPTYQQADGGLVTNYGESGRPTATANALLLLRYIGRLE
jgi:hypothetical protein